MALEIGIPNIAHKVGDHRIEFCDVCILHKRVESLFFWIPHLLMALELLGTALRFAVAARVLGLWDEKENSQQP